MRWIIDRLLGSYIDRRIEAYFASGALDERLRQKGPDKALIRAMVMQHSRSLAADYYRRHA